MFALAKWVVLPDKTMAKKILIVTSIFFLAILAVGLYSSYQAREAAIKARQNAKAPDTSITLLEGWTNRQIASYLQSKNIAPSQDFLDAAAAFSFSTSTYPFLSGKPAKAGLEGFIFPDTYFIPAGPQATKSISNAIISKSLDNFSKKVTPQMQLQANALGYNIYQIVTLASIIEKESGGDENEKKIIAGIFYNRLKTGMPLESDATISYITGHADVSQADKQIISPYNTYLNKGLPFGPICNPSLSSITAALYPTASDYLYFLTVPGTGQAVYAQTYDEHLANKAKYLK